MSKAEQQDGATSRRPCAWAAFWEQEEPRRVLEEGVRVGMCRTSLSCRAGVGRETPQKERR